MKLSEKALKILHANGWTEDRNLNTDLYAQKLRDAGCKPHSAVLRFLARFEGLDIIFKSTDYNDHINQFHFVLARAIAIADIDDIEDFGQCVGTNLCPIGEIDRGNSTLAIAEDGRVFSWYSPFISLIANTDIEAINAICAETSSLKTLVYTGEPLDFTIIT